MIQGRLSITIKINELPQAKTATNGWKRFAIDCEGTEVTGAVKPKAWNKLLKGTEAYPLWVAAISGKIGQKTARGFILEQPGIQVFEKKTKDAKVG